MEKITPSISKRVYQQIEATPVGQIFGYADFKLSDQQQLALAQSLSRLTKKGVINRLTKGKYYKPKNSIFGPLKPTESEIVNSLTESNNTITGYVTGLDLFNSMGLTTQIPNVITIATNKVLPKKKIGVYRIKYIKQNTIISKNNIPLLQLLDAIKAIKRIPDTEVNTTFQLLVDKLRKLDDKRKLEFLKEARNYNAATRAIVGALYEQYFPELNCSELENSLNPLTSYQIGISSKYLPNKLKWKLT